MKQFKSGNDIIYNFFFKTNCFHVLFIYNRKYCHISECIFTYTHTHTHIIHRIKIIQNYLQIFYPYLLFILFYFFYTSSFYVSTAAIDT